MNTREKWTAQKCDDGGWMVAADGDVICVSDGNLRNRDDINESRFKMLAASQEMYAALERALPAILSLSMWELGGAVVERTDGSGIDYQYPIRDELVSEIETALSKARAQ